MENAKRPLPAAARIALFGAIGMLTIATLAGWRHFGADILLDAASAGLSWCF